VESLWKGAALSNPVKIARFVGILITKEDYKVHDERPNQTYRCIPRFE